MKQKKGPRGWIPLELDPAVERLLHQYRAVLNAKLHKKKVHAAGLGKVVSAIVTHFLLPESERIQNDFEALLAWTARDVARDYLDNRTLETAGLSDVPYAKRRAGHRVVIPASEHDRHRSSTGRGPVRASPSKQARTAPDGSPG